MDRTRKMVKSLLAMKKSLFDWNEAYKSSVYLFENFLFSVEEDRNENWTVNGYSWNGKKIITGGFAFRFYSSKRKDDDLISFKWDLLHWGIN